MSELDPAPADVQAAIRRRRAAADPLSGESGPWHVTTVFDWRSGFESTWCVLGVSDPSQHRKDRVRRPWARRGCPGANSCVNLSSRTILTPAHSSLERDKTPRLRVFIQQGRQDSNLQPPVLETGALPIELRPWAAGTSVASRRATSRAVAPVSDDRDRARRSRRVRGAVGRPSARDRAGSRRSRFVDGRSRSQGLAVNERIKEGFPRLRRILFACP